MAAKGTVRIARKQAMSMEELIPLYIKSMKLSAGLNTQRVFAAWDEVSGAASFTLKRFFRDGKLYVTLSSSVVRNRLSFQKDALVEGINSILARDELFIKDDPRVSYVRELILK